MGGGEKFGGIKGSLVGCVEVWWGFWLGEKRFDGGV